MISRNGCDSAPKTSSRRMSPSDGSESASGKNSGASNASARKLAIGTMATVYQRFEKTRTLACVRCACGTTQNGPPSPNGRSGP